jgi:carboxymethylenebutenolidase
MHIDYYLSLGSPWTHLAARRRTEALATQHGATIRPIPCDFGGTVFPASVGLPLAKRSPQRQAYRMQELRRWRDALEIPIQVQPRHFPPTRPPPPPASSRCGKPRAMRRRCASPPHPEGAVGGGGRHGGS